MKTIRAVGLGEPEPSGKKSLFQPPKTDEKGAKAEPLPSKPKQPKKKELEKQVKKLGQSEKRVRATISLTASAFRKLKQVQEDYRVRYGKALPTWKAVSRAIEKAYGDK